MALILDTLGRVYKSMERGMTREQAEAAAMLKRRRPSSVTRS